MNEMFTAAQPCFWLTLGLLVALVAAQVMILAAFAALGRLPSLLERYSAAPLCQDGYTLEWHQHILQRFAPLAALLPLLPIAWQKQVHSAIKAGLVAGVHRPLAAFAVVAVVVLWLVCFT